MCVCVCPSVDSFALEAWDAKACPTTQTPQLSLFSLTLLILARPRVRAVFNPGASTEQCAFDCCARCVSERMQGAIKIPSDNKRKEQD